MPSIAIWMITFLGWFNWKGDYIRENMVLYLNELYRFKLSRTLSRCCVHYTFVCCLTERSVSLVMWSWLLTWSVTTHLALRRRCCLPAVTLSSVNLLMMPGKWHLGSERGTRYVFSIILSIFGDCQGFFKILILYEPFWLWFSYYRKPFYLFFCGALFALY